MSEHEDLSAYDEVEDGTVLRTLVDWKLYNEDNEVVTLDEVGEGKPFCSVSGFLIKPLSKSVRMKVVENLCTYGVSKDGVEREPIIVQEQLVKEIMPVEWDDIKVGHTLDGYCDKTFKWHKAKVVDIIRDEESTRFKVHFNGWKPKHDEWICKGSSRLAVLGQHTDVVMVDVVKPPQIPWYENTAIQALIEKEAMDISDSEEQREVTISDIEDWCVDYAYANPSLYLISHEGPWYRVMSPLVPGGGGSRGGSAPSHPLYDHVGDTFLEKFVAAAHCAYCLIEFLPTNRKLSFQNVVDEVDSRSGGRIDDYVLLVHGKFIIEQLSSLTTADHTTDQEIKFDDSYFMTQYKKRVEQYMNLKNEKKRRKKMVCISLMDKSCGGMIDFSIKVAKAKKQESIVPIKDSEYWRAQQLAGAPPPAPPPSPQSSNQLLPADCSHLLGDFLESWSILTNYKDFLSLPEISIEELLNELQRTRKEPRNSHDRVNLQEVHVQLLLPLVLLKTGTGDGQTTAYTCALANTVSQENEQGLRYSPNSLILWDSIQECCKKSSDPATLVKQFLRQGDMWVEVIRVLLSDRGEIAVPSEYIDTALVMQGVVEDLVKSFAYNSLLTKEKELEASVAETGSMSAVDVRYPQDLDSVLNAIKCGFYESGLVKYPESNESSAVLDIPKYCIALRVGTKLDAFCSTLHSWYPCEVVDIFSQEEKVLVTFSGWGSGFDETFSVHGKYVAPYRTMSLSTEAKDTHPDLLPAALLADVERRSRKEQQRLATRPAGYVPHEAIANDVERILLQIIQRTEPESAAGNGGDVLEEFRQAYNTKVVDMFSISNLSDSSVGSSDGDFQDVAQYFSQSSYESAPLAMKIRLLCWLCEAMVGSIGAKAFLEDVMEQKLAIEKASRMGTKSRQDENEEPGESLENVPRTGKRRVSEMLEESNEEIDEVGAGGTVERIPSDVIAAFDYRILPLGKDRNNSMYWAFQKDMLPSASSPSPSMRVFCEDHTSQVKAWKVFSDEGDVQSLLSWLSDYGINEVALKQKLKTLLGATAHVIVPSSPVNASMGLEVSPMHARYIDVVLGADGKLAAGVKDLDGRVIVSTFKLDEQNRSCAKDAGILICDQLISLNSHPIFDVSSLQKAMAIAKQSHVTTNDREGMSAGAGVTLSFLVVRYASPARSVPAISIALSTDTEFRTHFQQQEQQLHGEGAGLPSACHPETCVVADTLVGVCVEMLYSTSALYPSSPLHDFLGFRHYIQQLSEILYSLRLSSDKDFQSNILITCLRECLLDMEFALSQTGRGLVTKWGENRRQFKWKQCCQAANTFPKVAFCVFSLYQSIDWVELAEISSIIDHSKAQSYVSQQSHGFLPKPGNQIVFFGDAYHSRYKFDHPILECAGDVPTSRAVCKVLSAKHYKGGSASSNKESIPYVKLVLQIVEVESERPHPIVFSPSSEDAAACERKKLNRLLNLAVFVLLALPESVPFSSAVSVQDCPNYYDIITSPMHLGDIQQKVSAREYSSQAQFLADMDLIRDNCILYCSESYPSLLPLVETLHAAAQDLTRRLFLPDTGSDAGSGVQADSKAILSDTKATLVGEAGSTFTLCVPLDSVKYDSFIVHMDKYQKSAKTKMNAEDSFHILVDHPVRDGQDSDFPYTVTKRKGTIVRTVNQADCSHSASVPWRCLEVEWEEEDPQDQCGLFGTVNPWDIVVSRSKLN